MPDPEPVELVLQEYEYNPRPVSVKVKWRKKVELWIQTDKGIVKYHTPWLIRFRRWIKGARK
jgi:hypothetical protein